MSTRYRVSDMKKLLLVMAVVAVLGGAAFVGFRFYMGDSGGTTEIGGRLDAPVIPDFPTADAKRWVNGEAVSLEKLRGSVVLIEAWAPS